MIPTEQIHEHGKAFARSVSKTGSPKHQLRLFIAGQTPRSINAVSNVTQLCESHLHGAYSLQVVDIYRQPKIAKAEQVIAVPTLIKYEPPPLRRLIGSMANVPLMSRQLDLQSAHETAQKEKQ